jgi:hypothetical protein
MKFLVCFFRNEGWAVKKPNDRGGWRGTEPVTTKDDGEFNIIEVYQAQDDRQRHDAWQLLPPSGGHR